MPVDDSFVKWELGQGPHLFRPQITAALLLFSVLPCAAMAVLAARRAGWLLGCGVFAGVLITWSVTLIAVDTERLFAWGPFTAIALAQLAQGAVRAGRPGDT